MPIPLLFTGKMPIPLFDYRQDAYSTAIWTISESCREMLASGRRIAYD
jgi:hypothetical protein